jgi:hypothetical protein
MAFNLLNSVLNAKTTTRGLNQAESDAAASAAALDLARVKALYPEAFVSASALPGNKLQSAVGAGLSPSSVGTPPASATAPNATPPTGDEQADDIVVTGTRDEDNRLRLSALRGREAQVYGPNDRSENILAPLYATGGMMFPYTPSVQVAGDTDWTPHALTHTNYDIYSYQRTPSATITLAGKFTVQNQREGEYALACIHFLRTMGKMYYGEQDSFDYNPTTLTPEQSTAGLPPPVLRLRGYGLYMFNDVRCVLKGYSFSFEETMDLVTVQGPGGDIMLPPMFTLNVSLLMQQNPTRLRQQFKLDDFRTGALMRNSKGWF